MAKTKKPKENKILKWGIFAGLVEFVYIFLVITVMDFISRYIIKPPDTEEIILPMLFLCIFVFSATVSGIIVLGYPIYLITQKKFKEAVSTILITLATLFLVILLIAVTIFLIYY